MKKIIIIVLLLIPVLTLAQGDIQKKKVYYFYGEQCPHCKKVDEFFQTNGIYDKYDITKLEVVSNPFNGKLFMEFGKAFGVDDWGGVPTIVFGDKYLSGDTPIISNFVKEIDAADNAYELSNPDNIMQKPAVDNQNSENIPSATVPERNKKNSFPVIVIALVAAGIGALVFVNRKKQ